MPLQRLKVWKRLQYNLVESLRKKFTIRVLLKPLPRTLDSIPFQMTEEPECGVSNLFGKISVQEIPINHKEDEASCI